MRSGPGGSRTALRELRAAGVHQPLLRGAYLRCRELNAAHGQTYFLATRMLPAQRRPMIHALYGFGRWADDVVDVPGRDPQQRQDELRHLEHDLDAALLTGNSDEPLFAALADTIHRCALDPTLFLDFLTSMRMDLTIHEYPTRASLDSYVYGSAAVIGLQVLPILGTVCPREEAAPYATALGQAFQLTNFLRDIAEDLDRGRVYLPADELAAFNVDRERLAWCRRRGRPDAAVRRALADQVARTRAIYRAAEPGIALLDPCSRPCVTTAFTLYGEILDRIVESGYAVFEQRAAVPTTRRAAVGLRAAAAAGVGRLRRNTDRDSTRAARVLDR